MGVGAQGYAVIDNDPRMPENLFFVPDRVFEVRGRHSNFPRTYNSTTIIDLSLLNYLIGIFTPSNLCLADAIHSFKRVQIIMSPPPPPVPRDGDMLVYLCLRSVSVAYCSSV